MEERDEAALGNDGNRLLQRGRAETRGSDTQEAKDGWQQKRDSRACPEGQQTLWIEGLTRGDAFEISRCR